MNYTVEKTIAIAAPVDKVYEALTNSDLVIQYYPLEEVVSDWQVGSEFIAKGSIDGQNFTDYGKIDRLVKNKEFQYTYWSANHGTQRTPENYLSISYTLSETDKGTVLNLSQRNIKSEQMYSQMQQVWDFLLSSLKSFVEQK